MPHNGKLHNKVIQAFCISIDSHTIQQDNWTSREPHALWYGMPMDVKCVHPKEGIYKWCNMEGFNQRGHIVGFLPLPCHYLKVWIQLCYTMIYWLLTWKAWLNEPGRPHHIPWQTGELIPVCIENTGAHLIKYLHIWCLIIDEVNIFNKYLIHNCYDWLWNNISCILQKMWHVLKLDPVHPLKEAIFSESLSSCLISNGIDWRPLLSLEKPQAFHPTMDDCTQSLTGTDVALGKDKPCWLPGLLHCVIPGSHALLLCWHL